MAVNARDEEQSGNHHLGLGLSLSLGLATEAPVEVEPPPRRRAISVAPISSLPAPQRWNGPGLFFSPFFGTMDLSLERKLQRQPPATCHSHETPFTRGTDVMNRAPAGKTRRGGSCSEGEEQPGASSPNTTPISSLSGKRAAPARSGEEVGPEADHTRRGAGGGSDDEDCVAGGGSRKKLRLSKGQAAVLEESFKEHSILNPKQKAALAKQLNLRTRQVEVWFQNRRARTKLKQTEADCEVLKRCCETLAEENRRLQRQVVELRALELVPLAPHHHARMPPPTALTMRPFCVRCAFPVPVFVDGPAVRKL